MNSPDPTITVFGKASNQEVARLVVTSSELDLTLMDFLRAHGIPVASSCYGEGVCRKCVVFVQDKEHLSCLLTVKIFLAQHGAILSISYL